MPKMAPSPPPPALDMDPEAMRAHAGDAARLLRALANDKRLMLLCLLFGGERSVGELNARVDLSQSALSQHLAVLREEGIVATRREAQTVRYRIADPAAVKVVACLDPRDAGIDPGQVLGVS